MGRSWIGRAPSGIRHRFVVTSSIAATGDLAAVTGDDIMRRTESILAARGFATIIRTADRVGITA